MLKFMKKIPAGTFIVPLLVSALIYTIWPNIFSSIGGITGNFLGGTSNAFIIGMITFCSGIAIDVKDLQKLFKRHGVILFTKIFLSVGLSLLFIALFGQSGILGISALAFTVAITSINPSLYLSVVSDYGNEVDEGAYGLTNIFSTPAIAMLVYSFAGQGEVNLLPVVSALIPFILGVTLGNIDKDLVDLFSGGTVILIPILGWNIGQGMNLVEALQSGFPGILLAVLFIILMIPLIILDKNVLKNDGIVGLATISIAGSAAAYPAALALANPQLEVFVTGATAQIVTATVITILVTPLLSRELHKRIYHSSDKNLEQSEQN